MKIITDNGADLAPEWLADHGVTAVPLHITWENGESADDISRPAFYERLAQERQPPKTSQPSIGEFKAVYEDAAAGNLDILSIHISSGLSGTLHSAHAAARLVREANITLVDALTLSGAEGWQVRAAVAAAHAGESLKAILDKVRRIAQATETVYTLDTLHYLMLGGRIGKVKGTVGSLLNIKPLIAVEKERGTYVQVGTGRGLKKAVHSLVDHVAGHVGEGARIHAQTAHSAAPELAERLGELVGQRFQVSWLPSCEISPVLGTHTGPGLVGLAFAPSAALEGIEFA
jgi:DegV family protein with EDD domain